MNAVRHSAARSLSTFIFAVRRHMFGTPEVLKPRCERFHYQETAELDKCPHVSYQLHTQLLHLQAPSQFAIRTTCSDTSFLACHKREVRALLFLVCLTSEESEASWLKKTQKIMGYKCWSDRPCNIHSLDAWRSKPLPLQAKTNSSLKQRKGRKPRRHFSTSFPTSFRNSSCQLTTRCSPTLLLQSFQDKRDVQTLQQSPEEEPSS